MSSRSSFRLETRSRAKDEIKRVMMTIEKVRKWEKKWVQVGPAGCTMKVLKWMPIQEREGDKKKEKEKVQGIKSQTKEPSNDYSIQMNDDSNASFPSPAPPSEDSQGGDSMLDFPEKKNDRKRRASEAGMNQALDDGLELTNTSFDDSQLSKFGDESNLTFNTADSSIGYNICEDSNSNLPDGTYSETSQSDSQHAVGFTRELIKAASEVGHNPQGKDGSGLDSSQDEANTSISDLIHDDNSKDSDTFPLPNKKDDAGTDAAPSNS